MSFIWKRWAKSKVEGKSGTFLPMRVKDGNVDVFRGICDSFRVEYSMSLVMVMIYNNTSGQAQYY